MIPSPLRAIPSVDRLVQALGPLDLPRPAATAVVRRELAALRAETKTAPPPDFDAVLARVRAAVDRLRAARLQPVINGTGVLLHTNLGRAPLPAAALAAVAALGADYNNLEYDLAAGERGKSRAGYLEHNLALLCGAEAAAVTNNCAAALILMLRHFTRREGRKEVVVSRGELEPAPTPTGCPRKKHAASPSTWVLCTSRCRDSTSGWWTCRGTRISSRTWSRASARWTWRSSSSRRTTAGCRRWRNTCKSSPTSA